ncbi:MAG: hypothetical protein LUE86_07620, partial [Clostridiales bacterium]|nr:hypothetical protein [Clostridiales bacterium]
DGTALLPADLTIPGAGRALLTIREGKFHQVKRMFETFGCRVTYLKRLSMGSLRLDESLAAGEYRELSEQELSDLFCHGMRKELPVKGPSVCSLGDVDSGDIEDKRRDQDEPSGCDS